MVKSATKEASGPLGSSAGGSGTVPPKETREQKFTRLAIKRMRALKARMRLVKNLATYPHTKDQAEKIISECFKGVHEIKSAFEHSGKSGSARDEFAF